MTALAFLGTWHVTFSHFGHIFFTFLIRCPRATFFTFFPTVHFGLVARAAGPRTFKRSFNSISCFHGANLSEGMACLTCLAKPGAIVLCPVSFSFEASSSPHLVSSLLCPTICQCARLVLSLRGFSVCVAGKHFYGLVCQLSFTAVWS